MLEFKAKKWTEERLRRLIHMSANMDAEEMVIRVSYGDEESRSVLKKCGFLPLYEAGGCLVYPISLRQGFRGLDDFLAVKSRASRAARKFEVMLDIRQKREEGLFGSLKTDLCTQTDYHEHHLVTFWGTNCSGKSTVPKELIKSAYFREVRDPFYTMLAGIGEASVIMGTYNALARTGGMDVLAGACRYRDAMRLVRQIWMCKDVRVLILEGHIAQSRRAVLNELLKFNRIFPRTMSIFHCTCHPATIAQRLYKSTGKQIQEYKDGGTKILKLADQIARVLLTQADKRYFNIYLWDTDKMSIPRMVEAYKEIVG